MKYYFNKTLKGNFENIIQKTTKELNRKGFEILSDIDMKDTLDTQLNVDFYNYTVLGVCNPSFIYVALQAEDKIGTLLPCHVIFQEKEPGIIEVSATNPLATMSVVNEIDVEYIAWQIRDGLKEVIEKIQ